MTREGSTEPFDPDWTVGPGATLAEWCKQTKTTQRVLAAKLGITEKHLSQIVHNKTGYSPALAVKLEPITQISAAFWWRLLTNYQLDKALGKKDVSNV